MRRRLVILALTGALACLGVVGSATPASASCIETGIDKIGCVNPCPPGPWNCTQ